MRSEQPHEKHYLPVLAICGYSGSGKTTLNLQLIDHFRAQGKLVAVVKHDVHGLSIDREGKDSDRFFKTGADVVMRGPEQTFMRSHKSGSLELMSVIRKIAPYYDLILLEGHKSTPHFDKIWLHDEAHNPAPPEADRVKLSLSRQADRFTDVLQYITPWLEQCHSRMPINLGIINNPGTTGSNLNALDTSEFQNVCVFGSATAEIYARGWSIIPGNNGNAKLGQQIATAFRMNPLVPWVFVENDAFIDFRVFPFGEGLQTVESFNDLVNLHQEFKKTRSESNKDELTNQSGDH
jgi:molybdopterin-guanine dinucleotide biosynthesis protein MobB